MLWRVHVAAQPPAPEPESAPPPEEAPVEPPQEPTGSPILLGFLLLSLGEALVPDVRWEVDETSGVLLTWPIVATLYGEEDGRWGLGIGIEPQYSLPDEAWRGGAFAQVSYFFGEDEATAGLYNQSGYLIGQDGNGPFTTLGLAYGHPHIAQIGVLGRIGSYDGEARFEVGLDVQLHWMLWLLGED